MGGNKCIICNCEIHPERVIFLTENNREMCCTVHAQPVRIKAIYSGEHGTSDLIFCDRVYADSVRSKLYDTEFFEEGVEDSEETTTDTNYE